MSYQVRFAPRAADDLQRLFDFMALQDVGAAGRARVAIGKAIEFLQTFPFACRKAAPDEPFIQELVIEFGRAGYVALYEIEIEIENDQTVPVLAVRQQRERDFF